MGHTRHVRVLSVAWNVGLPALLVIMTIALLVTAVRGEPSQALLPGRDHWWLALVWLVLVGDALLGDHRPVWERAWKGLVAALFLLATAVAVWRRRRIRSAGRDRNPMASPCPRA